MRKKLLVLAFSLVCVFTSVYAMDNTLNATVTGTTYNAGGNVTGRVNMAPSGISGSSIGFKKGDKISTGLNTGWLLMDYQNYDVYNCTSDIDAKTITCPNNNPQIQAWMAISTNAIETEVALNKSDFHYYLGNTHAIGEYKSTKLAVEMDKFNEKLRNSSADYKLITYRNWTTMKRLFSLAGRGLGETYEADAILDATTATNEMYRNAFTTSCLLEYQNLDILGAYVNDTPHSQRDVIFDKPFWGSFSVNSAPGLVYANMTFRLDGNGAWEENSAIDPTIKRDLRPSIYLDTKNVVFAISQGKTSDIGLVTEPVLPNTYTSLYGEMEKYSDMKARIQDDNYQIILNDIKNKENNSITKISVNELVTLNVSSNNYNSSTVSVLLFDDKTNAFKFYKPLDMAGKGDYDFDLTGIPIGKYKVAVVNEAYDESSVATTYSSLLSDFQTIEIVTTLSNLSFTQTGNLKFNRNVNTDDKVGSISSSNGAGTPVYTLVADSAHAIDVAKFEIGTDGKTVQVKGNALDAGTYYFKIQAQDENGHPVTPLEISATVTVLKDSATIAFDETTQTKKSIASAQTPWNETATSTPSNNELKVTYSKKSGDIGIITIDQDTGAVQASSANAKGKVTIQATVDDDPTTGKDNYEATSITKEIMIYQEVNGSVTPDTASSDPNNPTFGAMDENIKIGGKIGVITGSEGTPDNGVSGTTTYTYGLKSDGDSSYFNVNSSTGAITSKVNLSVENYTITVTVSDKWSTKDIPVTISVGQASAEVLKFYDANNKNTIITSQSASLNANGVSVFAEVKGSSNTNTVKYGIKSGASTSVVDVQQTSGAITIKSVGTTTITATKLGEVGQAEAYAELTFTVTEGTQNFIYTDNAGNELPKNADGSYQSYKETGKEVVYQKDKSFQLYTHGTLAGSTITYGLKSGSPTDVIRVDADGKVHILNASLPIQTDKIIVEATSSDPNGNYADKTIEIAINIAKTDVTISFNGVTNVVSGTGSVNPLINDQDISSNEGGVSVVDTQYIISVDASIPNDIAWTNDGISIKYDYSEETGIDIPLKVIKPANRNYNKAEANGTLHILSPTENILEVSTPGKITYGDNFTIRSLQDDSSSTNVNYTFTSKDASYIKENTQTGNQMKFDAIKASGNSEIEVEIERSADGELPLKKTIKVKVLPKEISIKVDDKEKLYGEANPVFTYEDFTNQLISWNGVEDSIAETDINLSSIATVTSGVGTYDINVDIANLNKTYPNYNFKFTKGILTISEELIKDDWYHMETNGGNPYVGTWTNQDVKIIPDHPDYTELSTNKQLWQNELLINLEGRTKHSFYMKKATGAISSSKEETLLIDKTPPKVTSIKGIETTKSRIGDLLNAVTFNTYYKPGVFIEIQAEDGKTIPDIEVSDVDKISYSLYEKDNPTPIETNTGSVINGKLSFKLQNHGEYKVCAITTDKAGNSSPEKCEEIEVKKIDVDVDGDGPDFNDPDGDGCPDLNIKWKNPDDTWTKLNVDQDGDGIPEMNIDSKGTGKADLNVDTDNDGKPDLNLVVLTKEQWVPTICVTTQPERYCTGTATKAQINIDLDNDMENRVPDINININGGMKAEINITKPDETKPYLNIASTHSKWVPNKDYTYEKFNYDTDTSYKAILNVDSDGDGKPDLNIDLEGNGKPDINIDADGDGIPETDIDTDGDGIADINIDRNKDGIAEENIIKITEWKPDANGEKDGFLFDTMGGLNGNDYLKDNDVIVNKPGGSFLPNFSLKVDKVTDTLSEVMKGDIISRANGQVIEEIYDVKLMKDNIQIQPDGKLQIKLPIPEGVINPHLVVEQKDGTYIRITPEIKDGYLIYESDFLGKVSIVGDHREVVEPKPQEPTPDTGGIIAPNTSVKGAYTTTGSNTGDTTQLIGIIVTMVVSIIFIISSILSLRASTNFNETKLLYTRYNINREEVYYRARGGE